MPSAKPRGRSRSRQPPLDTARRLVSRLIDWFSTHARDLPWRRTLNPYAIWVSEIMLQQTQVKTVIPYWVRWMRRFPELSDLADARPQLVLKLWEGLGYYSRARNLQKGARQILDRHQGVFPVAFEKMLALPGIGRYTAGAIASIAFNQPRPVVDGNVTRVLTRLFALPGNPRENPLAGRLWALSEFLVQTAATLPRPEVSVPFRFSGGCSLFNQALMELGATLCKPQQPDCAACPVRRHCAAHQNGTTTEFPRLPPRAATITRRFLALLVEHQGKWLVRRRPNHGVNRGLWEFPNLEITDDVLTAEAAAGRLLGLGPSHISLQPFHTIRHSITRYRIDLEAHHARLASSFAPEAKVARGTAGRWVGLEQLEVLPFTGAHRRLLHRLRSRFCSSGLRVGRVSSRDAVTEGFVDHGKGIHQDRRGTGA